MEGPHDHGDRRARFAALFEAHHRAILAYALRRTRTEADAEDAVAESFAIAWRRIADVPLEALPWLYGVTRRVLANQRRAEERRVRLGDRLRALLDRDPTPVAATGTPALDVLASLSADDQELLRLVAWEQLSHGEIATVLGITPNAVAIRLHRARARFAGALAATVKGSGPGRTSDGVKGRIAARWQKEAR